MTYTTPFTAVTGTTINAADWNTSGRDNLSHLHGDAGPITINDAIDFPDTTGDKIRLWSTTYGIGINTNEWTLYLPSSATPRVRNGAWNGAVLGTLLHSGNQFHAWDIWHGDVSTTNLNYTDSGNAVSQARRRWEASYARGATTFFEAALSNDGGWASSATKAELYCLTDGSIASSEVTLSAPSTGRIYGRQRSGALDLSSHAGHDLSVRFKAVKAGADGIARAYLYRASVICETPAS